MPRGGKNHDANKPKGRMTSYAYFVQTCREEHKKKHPGETVVFSEFSKKCAERWKIMSDMEKKRFTDMADRDKKRFEHEMQDYTPPKGAKGGKRRKAKKDPNAPKRSLSAFFWFCNDERARVKASNPEYGIGDVAKVLGKMWSEASQDTKRKYEAMAERDKARYDREMTAYKSRGASAAANDDDDDDEDEDEDDE
jgi:high mobility group protein B1